ncbi:MAG: hypothetical protein K2V38_21610 [Gemmataceae bacterium]|nr:hypothetical protein [Gemmataceae bacterium]
MPSLPDWAIDEAQASLKLGLSVPAIEQRLVAKGLSPRAATAAVNAALEKRLQASSVAAGPSEESLKAHRFGSAVAACLCLAMAAAFGGGMSAGKTFCWLMLPVACIWWPEVFGDATPPALVRWVAWGVLLLICGYRSVLLTL